MSVWKSVHTHYDRAHDVALHGDYNRAIKHLDYCIDLLTKTYGSPVHYKLAIFYCKLGRALLRISQNPIPDSDSEGVSASGSSEITSLSDADSSSESDLINHTDANAMKTSQGLREPFNIIIEKFNLALECISATPSSKRNSTHTLLLEAEVYQSMGETALVYNHSEVIEWLTHAMGLYLRIYSPICTEIGACRFFLGKYHFKTKDFHRAVEEFRASFEILKKLELLYREQIRALIKLEHEAHFHFSAKTRLRNLRSKKSSLRKKLNLTKVQMKDVDGLLQLSQRLQDPSQNTVLIEPTLDSKSNDYTGGLLCMRSLGITAGNKLTSNHVSIDDNCLNWALASLPPNFTKLANSEINF